MQNHKIKKSQHLITNEDPRTLSLHASLFLFIHPIMSNKKDLAPTFHSFTTKLVIQLTVYTPKAIADSGKSKKTELKVKKTKEATFTLSSDNHLEFLQCLLTKHGQNSSYKVTEQKRFSFKYIYPVSKA